MDNAILYLKEGQDEQAREIVSQLKQVLDGKGIRISFSNEDGNPFLYLAINEETVREKIKRNAGRNRKTYEYRYSDVRKMIDEGMDKKDIMEKLGMPRATFYRRLKAMQEYTGEYDRLF
jgi:hypothetical protein